MRLLVVSLLLAVASLDARADALSDAKAAAVEVQRLDTERAQLEARRAKLAGEQALLATEIDKLKAQPAGVRRDFNLRELLAAAKTKADDLERVSVELRGKTGSLAVARRKLIVACDRALATPQPEARRLELTRLRTAQAALLATPSAPLGIGKVAVDPLDGPRELTEKADLLRDSRDKLRREVTRLASRIDDVERRRHLRERAGAVDDDMFGESASNRRFARLSTATTTAGARTNESDSQTANPTANAPAPTFSAGGTTTGGTTGGGAPSRGAAETPSQPPPSGFSDAASGAGKLPTTTGDATVLRNLVDPATLAELRRADGGDDLDLTLRALKRAQGELTLLADELDKRAKSLSSRADELKKQK